ncbi:MAG: phage major capsid protein [Mycobacterium sp.]|nr:phage major capsid protein [Mycobacterium sp.]
MTAEWLSEGAEASDASPTLAGPSIGVHKLGVFVPVSYELLEDSTALLAELGRLMRDAYDQLTNEAYTLGSGEGRPYGVVTGAVAAASAVPLITPTTAESFTAPDLYKLQTNLPPRWQARAQWCANLARINDTRQFETENGSLKFPSLQDNPPTLLGRGVNELSNMDGSEINASETKDHYS